MGLVVNLNVINFYQILGGFEMEKLIRFIKDEEGVTAIEYSLIAALIAVGIIVSVEAVRDGIINVFTTISGRMSGIAGS